jgi:hypothetical protein
MDDKSFSLTEMSFYLSLITSLDYICLVIESSTFVVMLYLAQYHEASSQLLVETEKFYIIICAFSLVELRYRKRFLVII